MQCPLDQTTLAIADRQGIEVDYCPTCRGVWLDRGELDKLIDRVDKELPVRAPEAPRVEYREAPREHYEHRGHEDHYYGHDSHHRKKHKKDNLLGEIFGF